MHTPTPWYWWLPRDCDGGCRTIRTEKGRTHGGYRGTEIASTFGLSDDDEDKANADLMIACVNAFHDDQGRTLEDIPQGLVWRLMDASKEFDRLCLVIESAVRFQDPEHGPAINSLILSMRDILDSLRIKEPKNG